MDNASPTPRRNGNWPAAVVFDFDGLLADTDACWRTAYERCMGRRGQEVDRSTLRELAGASVATAAARLGVPHEELSAELGASFRDGPLATMAGAQTLVSALSGRVPLAVASNGPEQLVRYGLTRIGLAAAFLAVISAEQLARPKPAPDVYLAACTALGVDPSDAVAIEDSMTGARAAASAGMIVICVPTPRAAASKPTSRPIAWTIRSSCATWAWIAHRRAPARPSAGSAVAQPRASAASASATIRSTTASSSSPVVSTSTESTAGRSGESARSASRASRTV